MKKRDFILYTALGLLLSILVVPLMFSVLDASASAANIRNIVALALIAVAVVAAALLVATWQLARKQRSICGLTLGLAIGILGGLAICSVLASGIR